MSEANGIRIICGDSLEVLPTIEAGSVDLITADPPYNIAYHYPHYADNLPHEDYLAWLETLLCACRRVLPPTGSLWVQQGPAFQAETLVMLKRAGFHWRNTVIWRHSFGRCQKKKFTPTWTALHYVVMNPKRFTWHPLMVPSARQTVYGDKRANPAGKPMDDVWDVARVCGTFTERVKDSDGIGHGCQTPLEIMRRIVGACSNPGDLVLDPVAGTGSTLAACAELGRRAIGIELSPQTAEMARRRLAKEQ